MEHKKQMLTDIQRKLKIARGHHSYLETKRIRQIGVHLIVARELLWAQKEVNFYSRLEEKLAA